MLTLLYYILDVYSEGFCWHILLQNTKLWADYSTESCPIFPTVWHFYLAQVLLRALLLLLGVLMELSEFFLWHYGRLFSFHLVLLSCQLWPFYAPGSGSPFLNISEILKFRMHTKVAYFSCAEWARIFVCRGNASPNLKVVVQLVRRYISGHKGPVSCLLTFLASSSEVLVAFPHYFLLTLLRRFFLTGGHWRSSHG